MDGCPIYWLMQLLISNICEAEAREELNSPLGSFKDGSHAEAHRHGGWMSEEVHVEMLLLQQQLQEYHAR